MPDIDVTDVLLDPDFCEAAGLTVYRRTETMLKGRPQITSTLVTPAPFGVVLPVDGDELKRAPDQQNLPRKWEVHSPFRLRPASQKADRSQQYPPDVIVFNGDFLQVFAVADYSHFGAGWIKASCVSVDPIDFEPV